LPQLALEKDGSGALLRRYIYGNRRISMSTGAATFYYHYDALGSVRNVTSSTGASEWTYTYEPFGATRSEIQNDPQAPTNVMKFAGELSDPTGLYYLRARQYDPGIGRFIARDPAEGAQVSAISTYVYAGDRSTVMVDPSGMAFIPSDVGQAAAQDATSPAGQESLEFGPARLNEITTQDPFHDHVRGFVNVPIINQNGVPTGEYRVFIDAAASINGKQVRIYFKTNPGPARLVSLAWHTTPDGNAQGPPPKAYPGDSTRIFIYFPKPGTFRITLTPRYAMPGDRPAKLYVRFDPVVCKSGGCRFTH